MELLGEKIGPYSIMEVLGRGGMGVVYRGQHSETGQSVAVKTVTVLGEGLIQSIRREIRALVRIQHPQIVGIVDEGVYCGLPWYAMELLTGETLRLFLERFQGKGQRLDTSAVRSSSEVKELETKELTFWTETLDPKHLHVTAAKRTNTLDKESEVRLIVSQNKVITTQGELQQILTIVRSLCVPLSYLHGEGIVHRDIKPENILITHDNTAKLVDFGLMAQYSGRVNREALVIDASSSGTACYMAPEQIRGEFVDGRADIYSLGCILYELLVGIPPFVGHPHVILNGHLTEVPIAPSELNPFLPRELDKLISRLLEKNPKHRIGYADAVAAALDSLGATKKILLQSPKPRNYLNRSSFIGRDEEYSSLCQFLNLTREKKGKLVLIGGDSGSGKTRLVMELGKVAVNRDMYVITGECRQMSIRSLEAFKDPLQLIADRCRERGLDYTNRIFGDRGPVLSVYEPSIQDLPGQENVPVPEKLTDEAARLRLFRNLSQTLAAFASEKPVVFILDDLQWADDLSTEFLLFLLRSSFFHQFPVIIIGTYRSEEIDDSFAEIKTNSDVSHIDLARLSDEATGDIVCEMLSVPKLPYEFKKYLLSLAEGNPFFVAEFLRTGVEEGLLFRDDLGHWQIQKETGLLSGQDSDKVLPLPETLHDLIFRRMSGIPDVARQVLKVAAVAGREIGMDLLFRTMNSEIEIIWAAIEELRVRKILENPTTFTLRFSHNTMQKAVYSIIDKEERFSIHETLAKSIELLYADQIEEFSADLAYHYKEAEDTEKACPYFLKAARRARSQYAYKRAEQFYRSYLELSPKSSKERVIVSSELGYDILRLLGRLKESISLLEQAILDSRVLDDKQLEGECTRNLGLLYGITGDIEKSESTITDALELFRKVDSRLYEGYTLNNLADLKATQGLIQEANMLYEQALKISRESGDEDFECQSLGHYATFFHRRGDVEKAKKLYSQALTLSDSRNQLQLKAKNLGNYALLQYEQGNLTDSQSLYLEAIEISRQLGDRRQEAIQSGNLAMLYDEQGGKEAHSLFLKVITIAREIGDQRLEGTNLANIALYYHRLTYFDKANKLYEEALKLAHKIGEPRFVAWILMQMADVQLHSGQGVIARELSEQALGLAQTAEDRSLSCRIMSSLATILHILEDQTSALKYYLHAIDIACEIGDQWSEGMNLACLGNYYQNQGDIEGALETYQKALELTRRTDDKQHEALAMSGMASLYRRLNRPLPEKEAKKLLELVELHESRTKLNQLQLICELGYRELLHSGSAVRWLNICFSIMEQYDYCSSSFFDEPLTKLYQAHLLAKTGKYHLLYQGERIKDIPVKLWERLPGAGQ